MRAELSEELEATNRGVASLDAELDHRTTRLHTASEAKSRLLANISHELRVPVTSIVGLARLLRDPLSEDQTHQVGLTDSSTSGLLTLINELLDLTEPESGRPVPQREDVDVRQQLGRTAAVAKLRPGNGTVVECAVDLRTLAAARDAVARFARTHGMSGEPLSDLILAANELAINAVRHGGGRGTLRIWYDRDTVWCQVSDDGPGIPDAVTSRDPFADRPPSTALGGRGLWLVSRMTATTIVETGRGGTTVTIAARH